MRSIIVVGARPNFIKVGPLMPALLGAGHDAALARTGWDTLVANRAVAELEAGLPAMLGE